MSLINIFNFPEFRSDKNKMVIQSKYINIDTLQKKIKNLEEENLHLRIETAELRTTTTNIEEKEEQLVRDCFQQLGEYSLMSH